MDKPQKHPNHTESNSTGSAAEMTALPGTKSTGASSHIDPLAKNLINANPASDKKGILHPAYTDQSTAARLWKWVDGLSTTQKVVGGTLLAGSLGWLLLGSGKKKFSGKAGKKAKKHKKGKKNRFGKRPWGTAGRTAVSE